MQSGARSVGRVLMLLATGTFLYGLVAIFFQAPGEARLGAGVLVLATGGALGVIAWWIGRHHKPQPHGRGQGDDNRVGR